MSENASGKASDSTDSDNKDFPCPDCTSVLNSRRGLHSHHAQVHDGSIAGYDRKCPECGTEFSTAKHTKTYCSPECGSAAQRNRIELTCEVCGDDFETVPSQADGKRFCSIDCKGEWFSEWISGENHPLYKPNNTVVKPCSWCGEDTETPKSEMGRRQHDRVYCSRECHSSWRSENVRGEDHPLYKDSEVNCENCGNPFQKRPAKVDTHDKHFCCRSCHGEWISEHKTGEDHPRWEGGHVEYGPKWYAARRKALDRDDHTCQDCRKHASELDRHPHVHHIHPVRDFDNVDNAHELDNLVTLCGSCHSKWEGWYLRPDTGGNDE